MAPQEHDSEDELPTDQSVDPHGAGLSDKAEEEHKEPSLAPACVVVVILTLALGCAFCAFGTWFMFKDPYPLAEKGITVQLIPWIEASQLDRGDKDAIIAQLNTLLTRLEQREFNSQQMSRLRNVLQDNPVLMWGAVQSIERQGAAAGLSETELDALDRAGDRLMRMATNRLLSRNDIEFAIQNCCRVREDKLGLAVVEDLSADQIREYMQRAEQMADRNEIPSEPYGKTPAEGFAMLVDSALNVDIIPASPAVR